MAIFNNVKDILNLSDFNPNDYNEKKNGIPFNFIKI